MRLNEIIKPFFHDDAARRLQSTGYVQLGNEGSHGIVFKKPGSAYVVKLFEHDDKPYLAFLEMVKSHPNPHFPKFYGKLVDVGGNFYAIRMEELAEMPDEDETIDYVSQYVFSIDKDMSKYPYVQMPHEDVLKWMDEHPQLKIACDLIQHVIKSNHRWRADLKIDNLMRRGNTPVFIDPVAST